MPYKKFIFKYMEKPYCATNGPIPQHNTFSFDEIEFSSDFDSGNLSKVEKIDSKKYQVGKVGHFKGAQIHCL